MKILFTLFLGSSSSAGKSLNILLFTADDLGHEQLDFHGGGLANVTPDLSKFSANNHTFLRAHVNIAICAPSRSGIATGRYGHNSRFYGFNALPKKIPTVFAHFQDNSDITGILGKVPHSTIDTTFTWDFSHDYTIGGPPKPMRCVQNEKSAYIFDAFSDGKFQYKNNNEGLTFKAMQKAGKTNPEIQARVDLFRHRVVEEFYDLKSDPGSTKKPINSPEHQAIIRQFQKRLRT